MGTLLFVSGLSSAAHPNPIAEQRQDISHSVPRSQVTENPSQHISNPKRSLDLFFILCLHALPQLQQVLTGIVFGAGVRVLCLFHCPSPYETSCLSPIPCQLSILSNPISVRTYNHLQLPARRHLSTIYSYPARSRLVRYDQ